ncbi:Lytic transglycosylase catalytic subunit subunit [Pseudomonas sp. 8AS]|uniref:transglycosylase SLT domain-containing protein n=1 Tax=Pseudomonas sp. 8AS TaxID=2653163 RepID=UPI0012EFCF5B|nr:transglycosylase SLT domain-containing protein [Pseudomonas sp. 8AS]VXC26838.1 Lytic transglycosylase catalytic subunit subunit [Pseudomonas sp. 8AS]
MSIVSLNSTLSAHALQGNPAEATRSQLEVAAEQFEALFLQQILKQMRKAGDVLAEGSPMHSRELSTMRDFHDEVLAETLAGQKQAGIASLLVTQLSGGPAGPAELAKAQLAAREAALPERPAAVQPMLAVPSLVQPLRDTWQRGVAQVDSLWERGKVGFQELVERVIRQESAGNVAAVSPKGALGLMQLMPETAQDMARELGLAYDEQRLRSDAAYNKRLGSAYLDKMLDRYDGHQALALAAYNAGPARVDEWLQSNGDPRNGELSTREWIERIPYQETRDYTRRILDLQASGTPAPRAPEALPSAVLQAPLAQLKPALQSVALSIVTPAAAEHRVRSEAFAQPIRPERKEMLS